MSSRPTIKRTYGSRSRQFPSSPRTSSPPHEESPGKRKRPLSESFTTNEPPLKRLYDSFQNKPVVKVKPSSIPKRCTKKKNSTEKPLTQLHFVIDKILRNCPLCSLSYTKGAIDDEILHKKHCARVQRGLEWGKEEEKEVIKNNVRVVEPLVVLQGGKGTLRGRVIAVPVDATGKIGAKITTLLETINLALSAPSLTSDMFKSSKAYLFLVPGPINGRERIVGCVIAQRITTAMDIVSKHDAEMETVEVDTGLYCDPKPRPTPLGISRLFVPSAHRRGGIATLLLTAAARTFIHGCELDPIKGQVAFSQPTGAGRKLMESWGKNGVRIYQE